ncbi:MAG: hypothetical protein GY852_04780 [bacterium]|nr:hypothetical protein [bacterium]
MSRLLVFSLVLGLLLFSGCVVEQFIDPGAIAVWQQKDDGDWNIRYSLWNDNTKAWYTPAGPVTSLIANIGGDDHDPYIDSDGTDTAISVWSHESEGDADIYYSVWNTNTWTKPAPVATLSGYDSDPAVAMDFAGNAVAVWVHKNTDGTTMLYYSTYDRKSWSTPEPVDREHTKVSLPELSYSSTTGIFFLIWTESTEVGTRTFASGYSGSWVPAVEIPGQKNNAAFDTGVPTDERIGLGTAGKKREAIAVWPTTNGEVYSSTWSPSGWSTALMYGTEEMPDAEFEYGGVPYSVFIKGRDLHWSKDLYSTGGVTPVPGTGEDYRPALTFIGDRIVGITVFWTKKALPSEIYFGRWDGSSWDPVRPIDVANVPGEDRNPDVSPLMKEDQEWDVYIDWCGDGVIQWPNMWGNFEQCEVGIPCPIATDWCNPADCQCYYDYPNVTWCGDGIVQRPNSAGQMEECEVGVPCPNQNDWCDLADCLCYGEDMPPETHKECDYENGACVDVAGPGQDQCTRDEECQEDLYESHTECFEETCIDVNGPGQSECRIDDDCIVGDDTYLGCVDGALCISMFGSGQDECLVDKDCWDDEPTSACGDGVIEGNEACDIGGALINGIQYPAAPETCPMGQHCSECQCVKGVFTPRCGDGYISGQEQGANEECDTKKGTLPDTCIPPEVCNSVCRCEYLEEDDGMHYGCVEGGCMLIEGEGRNECMFDSDCKHYGCEDETCVMLYYPGDNECYIDEDCEITHTECIDEECVDVQGLGKDECEWDPDCIIETHTECIEGLCEEVEGEGQSECLYDEDCQEYHTECIEEQCVEVEGAGDWECLFDEDCEEIEPPSLDCGYICGQTSGAEVLAQGLVDSNECKSALSIYESITCTTTCRYSWFYRVDNVAGYDSCCCGMVKRFDCTDCPGQNPECPDPEDICNANAPSWYSP